MHNLQLVDTDDGGHFVSYRNDYLIDEGIYSELYACLFGTSSSEWWCDNAFGVQSEKIASRTENALKTNKSNRDEDLSLIVKAVNDDLARLTNKNTEIVVQSVSLGVYGNKGIEIMIEISGNSDTFNFIYKKTSESLDNLTKRIYCEDDTISSGIVTADSSTVTADSSTITADGGRI